eukprot:TRINITY_DN8398_c0_g1_i1.p1 TRINITY_DN8398_c0_g1~~TRINITY_DN8398_c0_g1_i1.p1  ORF type:complete len:645 (+),score=129.02 TRINITY_DN8398_c0_g1_i1:1814-3748(+)
MSNNKYPGPYLPPPTGSNPPQSHHFASQGYQAYQAPENVIHRGQTMEGGGTGQALYGNGPNIEIGIDLPLSPDLQSPGHDSVSSSVTIGSQASSGCRNSTTSTDSGRGSSISTSSTTRPTNTYGHQHRLSNVSSSQSSVCSSLGSSRQSHHSSSSSIQDRPEDRIFSLNIHDMISNGVPDEDILIAWLTDLHFEEYFNLFVSAGYDMPTISRMTPEDLTAIGIQNPAHRKKLKSEISKLNISDGLPNHIPGSLEEWLRLLRLEEYGPSLMSQGYATVQEVATISIEDLEDTGFYRLGHQKRLVLGIRKVKDLSRNRTPAYDYYQQQQQFQMQNQEIPLPSVQTLNIKTGGFSSFQQTSQQQQSSPFPSRKLPDFQPQLSYSPELIQINQYPRSRQYAHSHSEDLPLPMPEPMPPLQYPLYKQSLGAPYPGSPRFTPRASGGLGHPPEPSSYRMMRSYDDADILRRSDNSILVHDIPNQSAKHPTGGETLPRLKGTIKPKPVAKIIANTRNTMQLNQDEIQSWEEKADEIQICDNNGSLLCKSGTSSPNMTLRKNRSGSDAGIQMKRNSSFGSESGLPFANDNAGTIRMRSNSHIILPERHQQLQETPGTSQKRSAGDVLQDIGSMLSDLTDELDAMLKLDKEDQ